MPILELKDIGFHYPDRDADEAIFSNLDLVVEMGTCLHVSGRNGSGKSTLLKVVSGELQPTSGNLVSSPECKAVYMDQNAQDALAHDLTIEEQLFMLGRGLSSEIEGRQFETQRLKTELAQFDLGLDLRMKDFVGHLSGGQKQIICLLSVLGSGANLLCLDEFTSSMDTRAGKVAENILEQFIASGECAVLIISHKDVNIPGKVDFRL